MLVNFDKPLCGKHNLPFAYFCSQFGCQCSVRLCLKCAQEHPNKKDIDEDFIKENVYQKKIEIETEIVLKQYEHFSEYKQRSKEACILSSKNQQSIQNVESLLKCINDDKKAVFSMLEEFNFNHYEVKKKLTKIKNGTPVFYLASIKNKQLTLMAIKLFSQSGLERFRAKIIAAQNTIQKYKEFTTAVKRFGVCSKDFLEGLGFNEKFMMKTKIKVLLSEWKESKKLELCFNLAKAEGNVNRHKREESKIKERERVAASPKKRIRIFSQQMIRRAYLGKEN